MMQRDAAELCKMRGRAKSARHTSRQPRVMLASMFVKTENVHCDHTKCLDMMTFEFIVDVCLSPSPNLYVCLALCVFFHVLFLCFCVCVCGMHVSCMHSSRAML